MSTSSIIPMDFPRSLSSSTSSSIFGDEGGRRSSEEMISVLNSSDELKSHRAFSDYDSASVVSWSREDEFDKQASFSVRKLFSEMDDVLYGDTPLSPNNHMLNDALTHECEEWRDRFPHLRLTGKQLIVSVDEGVQAFAGKQGRRSSDLHELRPQSSRLSLLETSINSQNNEPLSISGSSIPLYTGQQGNLSSKSETQFSQLGNPFDHSPTTLVINIAASPSVDGPDRSLENSTSNFSFSQKDVSREALVEEKLYLKYWKSLGIDEEIFAEDGVFEEYFALDITDHDVIEKVHHKSLRRPYPSLTPIDCIEESIVAEVFDYVWSKVVPIFRPTLSPIISACHHHVMSDPRFLFKSPSKINLNRQILSLNRNSESSLVPHGANIPLKVRLRQSNTSHRFEEEEDNEAHQSLKDAMIIRSVPLQNRRDSLNVGMYFPNMTKSQLSIVQEDASSPSHSMVPDLSSSMNTSSPNASTYAYFQPQKQQQQQQQQQQFPSHVSKLEHGRNQVRRLSTSKHFLSHVPEKPPAPTSPKNLPKIASKPVHASTYSRHNVSTPPHLTRTSSRTTFPPIHNAPSRKHHSSFSLLGDLTGTNFQTGLDAVRSHSARHIVSAGLRNPISQQQGEKRPMTSLLGSGPARQPHLVAQQTQPQQKKVSPLLPIKKK